MANKTYHPITHGKCRTTEYHAWMNMKQRCLNAKNDAYHNYGGRGIKICDRWLESFENFYLDMGQKPSSKHSLDRINNDGNYEYSNCRWATKLVQGRNQRRTRVRWSTL